MNKNISKSAKAKSHPPVRVSRKWLIVAIVIVIAGGAGYGLNAMRSKVPALTRLTPINSMPVS